VYAYRCYWHKNCLNRGKQFATGEPNLSSKLSRKLVDYRFSFGKLALPLPTQSLVGPSVRSSPLKSHIETAGIGTASAFKARVEENPTPANGAHISQVAIFLLSSKYSFAKMDSELRPQCRFQRQ
jgi:hypothetical protein